MDAKMASRGTQQLMASNAKAPINEDDKKRLAEYLLSKVRTGLSGRDGQDIVDLTPSRVIFAGVLTPPREAEAEAARRGLSAGDAPAGTSIGLDFRVRPNENEGLRLRISAEWSHYYPVFPSYETLLQNYQSDPQSESVEEGIEDQEVNEPVAPDLVVETQSVDADAPALDRGSTDQPTAPQERSGQVMLPRVWRRKDLAVADLQFDAPRDQVIIREKIGELDLATAIAEGMEVIANDTEGWRHLGEPKERQRLLGMTDLLASRETYAISLSKVAGERAALPPWSAELQVDSGPDPTDPSVMRVRVLLTNTTPELRLFGPDRETEIDPLLQERSLFDAKIKVAVDTGEIVPFSFLLAPKDYRSNPAMIAKGINCVAQLNPDMSQGLETESLPIFAQPLYRTRDDLEVPFSSLDVAAPTDQLALIASSMDEYLVAWDTFLVTEAPTRFSQDEMRACVTDRGDFQREIARFRLGIETLRRDALLAEAFRLMNRAFQRLATRSGGRIRAWRLFQIGFIVSQLPSLAIRELESGADGEYAEALREAAAEVGVLWFPTGGGKTEAYLGLIAIALAYDRLRGKRRGVTAWMRFPLRMLSLQQLERLTRVIAALNEIRADETRLLEGDPFAVGYYVGGGVTPNRLNRVEMSRLVDREDVRERAKQLRSCPHCGSAVEVKGDPTSWRLIHFCTKAECFSNTSPTMGVYRGSLPLCVVDNEIYRYLPSVLVGTVDKLANAGFNKYFAHIMRGPPEQCPVHGYTSYDACIEAGDRAGGCEARKSDLIQVQPFKDPGPSLLIQDELHLLRDELGVFNGHYEGLLQYLGAKVYLPPKVLAATATIEAYDVQAFHIYLSRARRYPQPAWEQGESFYATSRPSRQRRLYIGVLCHTRAIEEPSLRILALYQREIRRLMSNPSEARQTIYRPDLGDDEILGLLRLYDLSVAYVNRRATGGSIVDKVGRQIDGILEPEGLGTLQALLLTGDQTIDVVGATLERIERELGPTTGQRLGLVL